MIINYYQKLKSSHILKYVKLNVFENLKIWKLVYHPVNGM
jgi:hypothetical protein